MRVGADSLPCTENYRVFAQNTLPRHRHAAKTIGPGSPTAYTITLALNRFDVIQMVSKGKAGLNSRKAAEFRCLLPQPEKEAEGNSGCHGSKDAEGRERSGLPFLKFWQPVTRTRAR